MSYQLGPASTPDQFGGASRQSDATKNAALLIDSEFARLDMWVSNAPVYYRIYRDANGGRPQNQIYVPSAAGQTWFLSIDRLGYGIEFKSAVPGQPAIVLCELIAADEIPD